MHNRKEYINVYNLIQSNPPRKVIDEIVRICRPNANTKYTIKVKEDYSKCDQ